MRFDRSTGWHQVLTLEDDTCLFSSSNFQEDHYGDAKKKMSTTFPYTFQPQPPPHPKTNGAKRLPSVPIPIAEAAGHSEENDSDHSITDHTPPIPSRLTTLDFSSLSSPGNKTNVNSMASLYCLQPHQASKKSVLSFPSPKTLNNNNSTALNLNEVTFSSVPATIITTTPILIINSNSNLNGITFASLATAGITCNNSNISNAHASRLAASNTSNNPISSNLTSVSSALSPLNTAAPTKAEVLTATTGSVVNSVTGTSPSDTFISTNNSEDSDTSSADASSPTCKENKSESPTSPTNRSCSPFSNFAYEHDHDYDNVGSPCSSTASGPIYVRPPGFKHHAHEVLAPPARSKLKKKKNSTTLINLREGTKKREATPPKLKPRREPLPMKLRALPQSFWQQPNVAHQISPSSLYLPPLPNKESEDVLMDVRPVTPPDERESVKKPQAPERKLTVANTDLLFKLFEGIGEEKKAHATTRARGLKTRKLMPKSDSKGLFHGNDPYMVEAMSEKIFPQLTLEGSRYSGGGNTSLQLITLREGDRTVTLPSLSLEQNYPQMLSELVMHI